MEYGTGAVMAVPAHDQRDFEFAKKYDLPIRVVIQPRDREMQSATLTEAYVDEGMMVDSGSFSGLANTVGKEKSRRLRRGKGLGQESDSLSFARLGRVAPALLGHADTHHLLRSLRHGACAGESIAGAAPERRSIYRQGRFAARRKQAFLRSRLPSVRRSGAPRNRHHGHFRGFVVVFFALHVSQIYRGHRLTPKKHAIGWRWISISAASSTRFCIFFTRAFLPRRYAIWAWSTSTSRSVTS